MHMMFVIKWLKLHLQNAFRYNLSRKLVFPVSVGTFQAMFDHWFLRLSRPGTGRMKATSLQSIPLTFPWHTWAVAWFQQFCGVFTRKKRDICMIHMWYIYIYIYIYTRNAWALPRRCSVEVSHSQTNADATSQNSYVKNNNGTREY